MKVILFLCLFFSSQSQGLNLRNNNLSADIGFSDKYFIWSTQFNINIYHKKTFLMVEYGNRPAAATVILRQPNNLHFKLREERSWMAFGFDFFPNFWDLDLFFNFSYLYSFADYKGFSKDPNNVWKPQIKLGYVFDLSSDIRPFLLKIYYQYAKIPQSFSKYYLSFIIPLDW